jgi:hypothetical protein
MTANILDYLIRNKGFFKDVMQCGEKNLIQNLF